MQANKKQRTIKDINRKIKQGKAIVVTADEMTEIVKNQGAKKAFKEVDVVTTGTFAPMCSSGAFINFGHTKPPIKAEKVWLNNVPAYAGIAAVDAYMGATESIEGDPLNKIHPGRFKYGGGHVLEDFVAGKKVSLKVTSYGTDCYPNREFEREILLKDLPYSMLLNPRNAYQNYPCAINLSGKNKYTYMGILKAEAGNANYATSGQLSPLFNDPYYLTTGLGTKIFVGGTKGYVIGAGTQHNPTAKRGKNDVPSEKAATLMVKGDLKEMNPRWLKGLSILGYGCSLAVGIGIPIPVLNEEMARYTGVSDEKIYTQIYDYGNDIPEGNVISLGEVSYAELRSGKIRFRGQDISSRSLTSRLRSLEIANILKSWIEKGEFFLTEHQESLA